MDAATLKRLRERISPNIVQVYGSTEIGAAATCIGADEMLGDRLVSVGRPLVNGEVRVVTPGGTPGEYVADGEVGEVLVSSPSLAAEIWGDPEATAAAFVIDGERRWWRSRDLGRFDTGGYLYLEGRRDDMIISGGINIMPARVEDVLLAHPGVAECAVVGVPSAEWGEEVQAFIVGRDPKLDAAAIELHVRASELSSYQRPRVYHFVRDLPRTSTNKVLRRTLRETAIGLRSAKSSKRPPSIDRKNMSKTEPNLLIEHRGAIAIVTLNRPDKRNALRESLWHDLKNTFEGFGPDVRCVVLAGAGKHFLRRPRFVRAPASRSLREHFHVALRTRYARIDPVRRTAGRDRDARRRHRRRPRGGNGHSRSRRRCDDVLSIAGRPPRLLCRRRRQRPRRPHHRLRPHGGDDADRPHARRGRPANASASRIIWSSRASRWKRPSSLPRTSPRTRASRII